METGVREDDAGPARDQGDPTTRGSKKQRTRARLLLAAEEVFGMRGFNDASIVEITQRAGVALGTFYVYFPSKTAIFSHIIETRMGDLRDRLRAARDEAAGGGATERSVLRAFIEWAATHPHVYRAVRQSEYVEGVKLRDWYQEFVSAYSSRLAQAMAEGHLPPANPKVLAWSLVGMTDLVATQWISWGGSIPDGELDAFLEIAMRALGVAAETN